MTINSVIRCPFDVDILAYHLSPSPATIGLSECLGSLEPEGRLGLTLLSPTIRRKLSDVQVTQCATNLCMFDVASHRLVRQMSTKRRVQCRDDVDGCNNLLASPEVGIGGECVLEFRMHVCSKEEIGQQSERRKKNLQIPFTGIHLWNPQILRILQMACIDLWP